MCIFFSYLISSVREKNIFFLTTGETLNQYMLVLFINFILVKQNAIAYKKILLEKS